MFVIVNMYHGVFSFELLQVLKFWPPLDDASQIDKDSASDWRQKASVLCL